MILYRHSGREGKPPATDGWIGLQGLAECYPSSNRPHYTSSWGSVLLRVWQLALQCHLWFGLSGLTLSAIPSWPAGYDTVVMSICSASLIISAFFLLLGIIKPPLGQTGLSAAKWFFMQQVHISGPILSALPLTLKSRGVGLSLSLLTIVIYPLVWLAHKALTEDPAYFPRNKLQKGPAAYRSAILTYLCFVRAVICNGIAGSLKISASGTIVKSDGTKIIGQASVAVWMIIVLFYSLFEAAQVYPVNDWVHSQRVEHFLLSACDWAFVAGTFIQFTGIIAPKLWMSSTGTTPDVIMIIVGFMMGIWASHRFQQRYLKIFLL